MTGYVRTDTTNNIADGNIINATDLDNEFDGVQAAFNSSTGHNHDGTTGEGAPILVLGPTQDVVVGAAAVTPKTTNTVDLGSGSLKFKDLFLAGNGSIGGTVAVTGVATLTAQPVLSSLTASSAVATDASKGLVSVTNTGTGNNVLATSPTLVTPILGTPTSVTLTNATGLPVSTGISGLGSGVATFLATPSSANLAAAVTDETGTGALVFANSPTLVTPALGTPASGVVTNLTGTASININGTVGATTANTGAFTTLSTTSFGVLGARTQIKGTNADITGATGSGTEIFGGSTPGILAYNRDASAYLPLTVNAQTVSLQVENTTRGLFSSTGLAITGSSLDVQNNGDVTTRSYSTNASNQAFVQAVNSGGAYISLLQYGASKTPYGALGAGKGAVYSTDSVTIMADTSTGIINFATGGNTERMRIDSAGNVGIGTSSPSSIGRLTIDGVGTSGNPASIITFRQGGTDVFYVGPTARDNNTDIQLWNPRNGFIQFGTNNAEQMRLTSTGLGIGTSSPNGRLEVVGSTGGSFNGWFRTGDATAANNAGGGFYNTSSATATSRSAIMALDADGANLSDGDYFIIQKNGNSGSTDFLQYSNASMRFAANYIGRAAIDLTLDTSGNLGLGVTPSAQVASYKSFQFGTGGNLIGRSDSPGIELSSNSFRNTAGAYIYLNTDSSASYRQYSGEHSWFTAPSGTAGDAISFSQVMTLDASGNLGVGTTSPATKLHVSSGALDEVARFQGTGSPYLSIYRSGTRQFYIYNTASATELIVEPALPLTFATSGTERARITSGGELLVGGTSQVGSNEKLSIQQTGNSRAAVIRNDAGAGWDALLVWNAATSGDNLFQQFSTEATVNIRGSISYNRGAGLVAYNVTSDYRAKDISGPVTDSGALIDSVPVYMGKMKGATQERPMFIAHEVPAYAHTGVKDAVNADGKPVYQQMDASALIPVMWAEIQSLRARLAAANI